MGTGRDCISESSVDTETPEELAEAERHGVIYSKAFSADLAELEDVYGDTTVE